METLRKLEASRKDRRQA